MKTTARVWLALPFLLAGPALAQSVAISGGDAPSASVEVGSVDPQDGSEEMLSNDPAVSISPVVEGVAIVDDGPVLSPEANALKNAMDTLRYDLDYSATASLEEDYVAVMLRHHRAMVYVIQAILDGSKDEKVKELAETQLEHLRAEIEILQMLPQPAE